MTFSSDLTTTTVKSKCVLLNYNKISLLNLLKLKCFPIKLNKLDLNQTSVFVFLILLHFIEMVINTTKLYVNGRYQL